jgi:CoA:oxalate CoA-transferase
MESVRVIYVPAICAQPFISSGLIRVNPKIVYASISGFGNTGPDREKGAYDMVIQGYGGIMSITGYPGGDPVRAGYSIP